MIIIQMPEIEIRIKVWMCSRCGHLWQKRRTAATAPITCPSCNSPYWNSPRVREKSGPKKFTKLTFHGEEVLESNFKDGQGQGRKK
jgi:DNA-directed RNA polymerase subunit RPC12/RpoP